MEGRVRSMLMWLIMAGLCGLIGFAIVHYYATNDRLVERFAIVVDAGSTQTRSNLFRISIDQMGLEEAQAYEAEDTDGLPVGTPLGQLLQVQQMSSCINGGPLADIQDEREAQILMEKCIRKFTDHIKLLDFNGDPENKPLGHEEDAHEDHNQDESLSDAPDADSVSKQMALVNHRVNSITHLHLGATAGMRALEQLNATRAGQKIAWVEQAIRATNQMLSDNSPYINQGYVGILEGADEASFGWVSVNFVCDSLIASAAPLIAPQAIAHNTAANQSKSVIYRLDDKQHEHDDSSRLELRPSVGTLELGGASAQVALQVGNSLAGSRQIQNMSLQEQQLDLFGGEYKLGTRSDLCLGMSQAVLRANYILLHKTMLASVNSNNNNSTHKIVNACMQKGSSLRLQGGDLLELWQGACLTPNSHLSGAEINEDMTFRSLIASKESIKIIGSGNVDQCNLLLNELIQPSSCRRYFAICPKNKNPRAPPAEMPFVTISGYNHALNVLELSPQVSAMQPADAQDEYSANHLARVIAEKLGGHPVVFDEFVQKTREFCSTDLSELLDNFPRVNKKYQDIICLQLVYIRKLLTEFYRFDPQTNWQQIKFLIFKPTSVSSKYTSALAHAGSAKQVATAQDMKPDFGWTLGLLLNATSEQLSADGQSEIYYYHHGASVMYIVRATILLILACFLIAIALLVVGITEVRSAQERAGAYISHGSSRSSYDISSISYVSDNKGPQGTSINSTGYLVRVEPDERPPP